MKRRMRDKQEMHEWSGEAEDGVCRGVVDGGGKTADEGEGGKKRMGRWRVNGDVALALLGVATGSARATGDLI